MFNCTGCEYSECSRVVLPENLPDKWFSYWKAIKGGCKNELRLELFWRALEEDLLPFIMKKGRFRFNLMYEEMKQQALSVVNETLKRVHFIPSGKDDFTCYNDILKNAKAISINVSREELRFELRNKGRSLSMDDSNVRTQHVIEQSFSKFYYDFTEQVIQQEAYDIVNFALQQLKPKDREILEIRQNKELTTVQSAVFLGITEDAAESRYRRALERLGKILESLNYNI